MDIFEKGPDQVVDHALMLKAQEKQDKQDQKVCSRVKEELKKVKATLPDYNAIPDDVAKIILNYTLNSKNSELITHRMFSKATVNTESKLQNLVKTISNKLKNSF
jgi:uncharacterized lipoprotein YmbA